MDGLNFIGSSTLHDRVLKSTEISFSCAGIFRRYVVYLSANSLRMKFYIPIFLLVSLYLSSPLFVIFSSPSRRRCCCRHRRQIYKRYMYHSMGRHESMYSISLARIERRRRCEKRRRHAKS